MTLSCAFFEHPAEDLADPYRNLLLSAVLAEATRARHSVLSSYLYRQGESLTALRRGHQQRRFDGAIIVGTALDPATLSTLDGWHMPLVLLDHSGPDSPFDQVAGDFAGGMRQVAEQLAARGRRRVALVIPLQDGGTALERQRGFLAGVRAHGLQALLEDGDWSAASGARAFEALMGCPEPPDAVVAANDRMALGCLAAAQRLGLRVPADVAICGFDDFETGRYTTPALSTVHVPYAEMAALAVQLLLERLQDPALPPRHLRLPVSFVPRASL